MTPRFSHLVSPIQVGDREVKNRMFLCPMERNFANPDWTVSERTVAHYATIAAGGVGWMDVEATFVDPAGRARTHQLGLHDDRCIPGFAALADQAHRHGALIGVELVHAGRNTSTAMSGHQVVAPSSVPCVQAGGDVPRELTVEEIADIKDRYAMAARRAEAAGFDAVELHSAHGYLPFAFLSPRTNLRIDEYGGSREGRMRFALEVLEAMRDAVSPQMIVGCRFSCDELVPGGFTLGDAVAFARALEAHGAQYLNVSVGVYESSGLIVAPMAVASGWTLPRVATIKESVSIPVIGAGRITDPWLGEQALADGRLDILGLGRALLTDPQLPAKVIEGRADEIVHCIGCNQGCDARLGRQQDVTCLVNPAVGRETAFVLSPTALPRTVAVVGGGPAGMEAARVASERGHRVTLFEREHRLGGQLALAADAPHRPGWAVLVADASARLEASDVAVRLRVEPTVDELAAFDVVVFATGAQFTAPPVRGAGAELVCDPAQLVRDETRKVRTAVVIDGQDQIGLTFADLLLARGAQVHLVSAAPDLHDPPSDPGCLSRLAGTGRLRVHVDRQVSRVDGGDVVLTQAGAIGELFASRITSPDAVVFCGERRVQRDVADQLRERDDAIEVHEIGDRRWPRTALEALVDAATVARGL